MSAQSYEDAERTRRIQEEIRRKIAERRGGRVPPPLPGAAPSGRPMASPIPAPRPVAGAGGGLRDLLTRKLAELQERAEAAAAAQRRAQQASLPRALPPVQTVAAEPPALAPTVVREAPTVKNEVARLAAAPAPPNPWRLAVRTPQDLRRAIVLREILGPPVGLG